MSNTPEGKMGLGGNSEDLQERAPESRFKHLTTRIRAATGAAGRLTRTSGGDLSAVFSQLTALASLPEGATNPSSVIFGSGDAPPRSSRFTARRLTHFLRKTTGRLRPSVDSEVDEQAMVQFVGSLKDIFVDDKVLPSALILGGVSKPDACVALATYAQKAEVNDWDKITVKAFLSAVSDSMNRRIQQHISRGDTPSSQDIEIADQINALSKGIPLVAGQSGIVFMHESSFLREYSELEKEGITVEEILRYINYNKYSAVTSESIRSFEQQYEGLSEASKFLLQRERDRYSFSDLVEIDQYLRLVSVDASAMQSSEIRIRKFEDLASLLGCDEFNNDEKIFLRRGFDTLLQSGAKIEGILEIFPRSTLFKEFLHSESEASFEEAKAMVVALASLEGFSLSYSQVSAEKIVKSILSHPAFLKEAVNVIKDKWSDVVASGYPPAFASASVVFIFSEYSNNLSNRVRKAGESDDPRVNYVENEFKAMQIIGDTSAPLIRRLKGDALYRDFVVEYVSSKLYYGESVDQDSLRQQLRDIAENLERISTFPSVYQALFTQTDIQHVNNLGEIENYIRQAHELTETSGFKAFCESLSQFGYAINFNDRSQLLGLMDHQKELFGQIAEIRKVYPEFRYVYDKEVTDPYELLAARTHTEDYLELLTNEITDSGSISRDYTDGYLMHLRRSQQEKVSFNADEPFDESYAYRFSVSLTNLLQETQLPDRRLFEYKTFFSNVHVLQALARQPEKVEEFLSMPQNVPEFFDLLEPGGALYTNRDLFIQDIFANGNAVGRAREIADIFSQDNIPYWKQLYLFTEARLGEALASAESIYPIDNIPRMEQSGEGHFDFSKDFTFIDRPWIEMDLIERRSIADLDHMSDDEVMGLSEIPFVDLRGEYKKIVFASLLEKTIRISGDPQAKEAAGRRNAEHQGPLELEKGMYIHASAIDHLDAVLRSGNLPGEALGEGAETDSFPFHTDFVRLTPDHLDIYPNTKDALVNTIAFQLNYGKRGRFGEDGQIIYLYRRDFNAYQGKVEEVGGRGDLHALVLGGYPATEISGIVLRSPESTLEKSQQAIVENGFYIPLYNLEGDLLFSQNEFAELVERRLTRKAVDNALADSYSPTALIDVFKREFKANFEADAGLWEGYSIEQHTQMVLSQFDHYFSDKPLPAGMTTDLMRVALTLHDIGKPEAIRQGDKNLQHVFTEPIVRSTMNTLGYTDQERDLVAAMIGGDPIGECMKAGEVKEEAVQEIIERARQANVPVEQFLDLLIVFYKSDAGSYTLDAGGAQSLDKLFDFDRAQRSLSLKPQYQSIIDTLQKAVLGSNE